MTDEEAGQLRNFEQYDRNLEKALDIAEAQQAANEDR